MSDQQASRADDSELLGAIDIVSAFTALRHELKLQVRGGRDLNEATAAGLQRVEGAVQEISRATTRLLSLADQITPSPASATKPLAEAVSEIEESLSRAVDASRSALAGGPADRRPEAAVAGEWIDREAILRAIEQRFADQPRWRQWFLHPFFRAVSEAVRAAQAADVTSPQRSQAAPDSAAARLDEGLRLLQSRVHRLMAENGIRRVDVVGKAFDPQLMNAIELVASQEHLPGHVAEQIRPAYLWQDRPLRVAEVRVVASPPSAATNNE